MLRRVVSFLVALVSFLAPFTACGDVLVTGNGARIVGEITRIEGGRIEITTTYAGPITVQQASVVAITTSRPLGVHLTDGTQAEGSLSNGAGGALLVVTPIRTIATSVANIRASWPTTQRETPPDAPAKASWFFEVSANLAGRSGTTDQFGSAVGARATRNTAKDFLTLRLNYDRQQTNAQRTADQARFGIDYQRNLARRTMWYVRNDAGYDELRDLALYDIAAGGVGYDLVSRPAQRVTLRTGLSYRYEDFGAPTAQDISSLGIDLGLANSLQWKNTSLVNRVTLVHGFDASDGFRVSHESYYEMPLTHAHLRFRFGLTNDYNAQLRGNAVERLDTTYFAQVLFTWQ